MEDKEVRAVQQVKTGVKIIKERLEWVLDKQIIDSSQKDDIKLISPKYEILMGKESSLWEIKTYCVENTQMAVFLSVDKNTKLKNNKVVLKLSVKTEDGQLRDCNTTRSCNLSEFEQGLGWRHYYDIKDLPLLCVNDKLTLVCDFSISIEKNERIRKYTDNQVKYETEESETQFVENIKTMYSLGSFSDLVLFCGDQKFLVHKNILASRSDVFKDMLENEDEKIDGDLEITDTSPHTFKIVIDHIYTGKIPNNIDNKAEELFRLATKYNLEFLAKACELSLLEQLTDKNALETLETLDKHKSTTGAKNDVIKYITLNAIHIIDTDEFQVFAEKQPKLMIDIFRRFAINQNSETVADTTQKAEGTV